MNRTKWLLLGTGCLAVSATVYWQSSFETMPPAPAPLQLKPAAASAPASDVRRVTASKDTAAPERAKAVSADGTAASVAKKAPARVNRREPPAAVAATHREEPLPAPARAASVAPARAMTYERRVTDAAAIAVEDSDRALVELKRLAADEPGRPEAYEAMAGISLRKRDYVQARELIESALGRGGKATFAIIHDHSRGNFDLKDPRATCVGELIILADQVRFDASNEDDRFAANWPDVRETGSNKFFGSGIGGFNVTINSGGKYKNVNLAPESKDKAEARLILELLKAREDRRDRTK
jgi:hypothetical protein